MTSRISSPRLDAWTLHSSYRGQRIFTIVFPKMKKKGLVLIMSAATPLGLDGFLHLMSTVDERPKNQPFHYDPPIWEDAPDFLATGFPDFLPGSEK